MEEGWGDDDHAREVRALAFGTDALGAARRRVEELAPEPGTELATAAAEVEGRWASWSRSVTFLREDGRPAEALTSARALVAAAEGHAPWSEEARELLATLETPEATAERELESELAKLLKPLASKSPRKGLSDKLRRFAEKSEVPPLARRALRVAAAVDLALAGL
jgi:hypothetical protein